MKLPELVVHGLREFAHQVAVERGRRSARVEFETDEWDRTTCLIFAEPSLGLADLHPLKTLRLQ